MKQYIPLIDLLSLAFNIKDIRIADTQEKIRAKKLFYDESEPCHGYDVSPFRNG